jgi:D-glycero-alpha-D-manno-heptose 1-phosphate guanylyltransferase
MAPVAGRPFLHYLLHYLAAQGITRALLSLGYRGGAVIEWLGQQRLPFAIDWVIEEEPLGTGGGIRLAMDQCRDNDVFIVNGDTMFTVALAGMLEQHTQTAAETTLALKAMRDFDRYGTVRLQENGAITSFEEKTARTEGNINGGIYLIDRRAFLRRPLPQKFSFEKDYLERYVGEQKFFGYASDAYFIDIGVPQDYAQAQQDFIRLFP